MAKRPTEQEQELLPFAKLPSEPEFYPENRDGEAGARAPLAARLRPTRLEEMQGHHALFSGNGLLAGPERTGALNQSLILWGPPGTGKTTLAHLLGSLSGATVHCLSAVTAGLSDLRDVVARCRPGTANLLFLDEIHRFNKSQQDALLPLVESGRLRLLGATTENPHFELRKALLSRCRVIRLEKLSRDDLERVLQRAIRHPQGYGSMDLKVTPEVLEAIASTADGDARAALNLLELAVSRGAYGHEGSVCVELEHLQTALNDQSLAYNRDSDRKYDLTSAFIKSIRGSDPDAALYWLACMLGAGEDPRYLMRRLLILASEDVGLADPSAVCVVSACAESLDRVGLPEGKYPLAQATLYLATAAKSDSAAALFRAEAHLRQHGAKEVPRHLRDGSYQGAREYGIGQGYVNPHSRQDHFVEQQYRPDGIERGDFYRPGNLGYEKVIRQRLEHWYQSKGVQ
jgi:putative ATPase